MSCRVSPPSPPVRSPWRRPVRSAPAFEECGALGPGQRRDHRQRLEPSRLAATVGLPGCGRRMTPAFTGARASLTIVHADAPICPNAVACSPSRCTPPGRRGSHRDGCTPTLTTRGSPRLLQPTAAAVSGRHGRGVIAVSEQQRLPAHAPAPACSLRPAAGSSPTASSSSLAGRSGASAGSVSAGQTATPRARRIAYEPRNASASIGPKRCGYRRTGVSAAAAAAS